MLGRQINRNFFIHMRGITVYVLLASVGTLAISLATAYAIYCLSDVSLTTALIGGAAGGVTEMATLGLSMKADVVAILFMQILRLILAIAFSSKIAVFIAKAVPGKTARIRLQPNVEELFFQKHDYVLLAGAAFAGAYFFDTLKIPNGIMMGAITACGLLAVSVRKTYRFEPKARYAVQISMGLILGHYITSDVAGELQRLLITGFAASLVAIAGSVLMAILLYKLSPLDIVTCILCTSTAGVSQANFLAEEMGADALVISIFQLCRLLSILAFYPWIVTALS